MPAEKLDAAAPNHRALDRQLVWDCVGLYVWQLASPNLVRQFVLAERARLRGWQPGGVGGGLFGEGFPVPPVFGFHKTVAAGGTWAPRIAIKKAGGDPPAFYLFY